MTLLTRWHRGWSSARSLPPATEVDGGLRVTGLTAGRTVEYLALTADDTTLTRLAALVHADPGARVWLTAPTTDPGRVAATLTAAGLTLLLSSEQLMSIELPGHPQPEPDGPYQVTTTVDNERIAVEVRRESGAVAASGTMGLAGTDAIADRIETAPEHRRRGLGSVVMGRLAAAALDRGASTGILIASEDGQHLYRRLGWQPRATVLIAARP